jgi:hypothetical protein
MAIGPGVRIHVRQAVTHLVLAREQFDRVPGRYREAEAAAGMQMFAGRDPLQVGGQTAAFDRRRQTVQRRLAVHTEAHVVHARRIRFAQHHAVVVVFIPGLEVHATLRIAPGLDQAQYLSVVFHRRIQIRHPQGDMTRTQHAGHRHISILHPFIVARLVTGHPASAIAVPVGRSNASHCSFEDS